ncbi:alkaline phosphatase D family protein [Roseivirga sp. BDSF3-8]|uniref:alkaline phosphatase D family protein n=1 Tax=Roseivirga sp. BDSF3-8 TaxID=3241598 RepID=UPI003532519C
MMLRLTLLTLFFFPFVTSCSPDISPASDNIQPLQRITFGSCSHQENEEQMWDEINATNPDLYIWLGDNIYGDTRDMGVMREKYEKQKSYPGYRELTSNTPVVGTWDDHDYGINNGGKGYSMKEESQQLALDFLNVPADAPERNREGLYSSHTFGPEGKRVQVILLDVRYFRDTVYVKDGISQPNLDGTILGEAQWDWLEEELDNSKADLILIGSGIQFIPTEHRFEKWANFPNERTRLLNLLADSDNKNVILLSGDRHIAEVSRIQPGDMDAPVYEVTSSGLTHTWREASEEANQYRVGDLIIARNFGLMEVDWSGSDPSVTVKILGKEREELGSYQIEF